MGHIRINFLLCITFLLVIFTCSEAETISSTESQKNQNLRAFAKLYGYVKYFHPSDEASAIDWDKFAVYGAQRVKDAKNRKQLKTTLEALFLPMAPTIRIYSSGQKPEDPLKHVPDDPNSLKVVAWQHLGVRGSIPSLYRSIRTNRENKILVGRPSFGVLTQSIDATQYRGKEIRLKAFVRTNVSRSGNQGQLWLRVDRKSGQVGFFDNMSDRPIKSKEWNAYEIVGKVAEDATRIVFGCFLLGTGQVWLDEFQLFVKGENDRWEAVEIANPGFEEADADNKPKGWRTGRKDYTFRVVAGDQYKGNKCLIIEIEEKVEIFSGTLFEKHPKIGEVMNKRLAEGLFCQIPLALYSDPNGTLGKNERHPFTQLARELDSMSIDKLTADDENLRFGDVVIAWNVFQHFYPYFDVVDVDWDSELTNALRKAMTDENERDFYQTLCRLIAKLQDGHGRVGYKIQRIGLPFRVDWIEDQVVVTASGTTQVHTGDIIVSIDDTRAERALLDAEEYISGSPQWRRLRALQQFGYGDKGTKANLTIKRENEIFQIQIERSGGGRGTEPKRPKIDRIQDDVYYVDLTRVQIKEIEKSIHDIAQAKGVVFDFRGYPRGDIDVLICHLLREKDTSNAWFRVPRIIYPDQENIVGYTDYGWGLEPKQPRIEGKVVFLTNTRAFSAAESYLSYVEHYKLGEIVGQPTAGTNGNVNRFTLPGDYTVSWTGMKTVKHDGSQHHLIGIQPTVPVQRTVQGVIEGRDEFLEKALEIINKE